MCVAKFMLAIILVSSRTNPILQFDITKYYQILPENLSQNHKSDAAHDDSSGVSFNAVLVVSMLFGRPSSPMLFFNVFRQV